MVRRGNEDGAAMAEYIPLLAVIAVIVVVAVSFVGPWVRETVIDASVPLDNGACPTHWTLTSLPVPSKKNDHPIDKNNDQMACVKNVSGNGNTGGGANVKDNNRGPRVARQSRGGAP